MTAVPSDTLARQRRAAEPRVSAWVSANAGSGKTHVLTQRVLRLLLAGVAPSRIVCLTFTKAAAATMSIRVFQELAGWTALDDAGLAAAVMATGAPRPSPPDLSEARKLFARTVETPGGLKIQTIHAFCERLLHLFPFEANVPARFEVLDDAGAADLLARARETALAAALADDRSGLGRAAEALTRDVAAETFDALLKEALGHRDAVAALLKTAGTLDGLRVALLRSLGLSARDTVDAVERDITQGGIPPAEWSALACTLREGGGAGDTGKRLERAASAPPGSRCALYLDVFLTQGAPRADSYLVKALRTAEPDLCARFDAERDRVASLLGKLRAARLARDTAALLTVAGAVVTRYEAAKRARGLLDFEDLVERTRTLLRRSDAAWVLYKLDRGIDHILVDEAQDTSPHQWEILQAISADFFAGAGRTSAARTVFAVGDEKQSIYSFQGARPDMFALMRRTFAKSVTDGEGRFEDVQLLLSFRSARAILAAVDKVFSHPENAAGLAVPPERPQPHEPLRTFPGLLEIWPAVKAAAAEEPRDWRLPVDASDPGDPPVVLARRIAEAVARWTGPGSVETVQDGGVRRAMRAGDVLILVRTRNSFFEAMIRALKDRHVQVAGADRLALTDHIAVMDLVAAGRAALSPDDDFTLACVLKSPLLGLDDEDLMALAPERRGPLLAALEASREAPHAAAAAKLASWRRRAARLTPFAFYAQLLGADGGRRDLLGRLGPEAGDAIDEFVALAVAHEREGAPSLLGFLERLDGIDLSVKRDMEAAGDAVRVMTVHAAKGLEAKVVILPDTCGAPSGRHDPRLFPLDDGAIVWSPRRDADAGPVSAARDGARRLAVEEHNRLLYVAMTRAEQRLYVAGFCGEKGPAIGSWYRMIEAAALDLEPAPAFWNPEETVLRGGDGGAPAPAIEPSAETGESTSPPLPPWLRSLVAPEPSGGEPPVRPSNPLGAADQFAPVEWSFGDRRLNGRRAGLAAGRLIHKLLQHLPDVPPDRRREIARRFLQAHGSAVSRDDRERLADTALDVLGAPGLAPLFGPGSRAEVSAAGRVTLPNGQTIEVAGQIDRVAVTKDAVLIADFKSGRASDPPSPQHRMQLALYRAVVAGLYPGLPVRAVLVWTAEARMVEIAPEALDEALRRLCD